MSFMLALAKIHALVTRVLPARASAKHKFASFITTQALKGERDE